jgi:hypothetical protein
MVNFNKRLTVFTVGFQMVRPPQTGQKSVIYGCPCEILVNIMKHLAASYEVSEGKGV